MTGKIFINYRRGDDPGHTGRLFDNLAQSFPSNQLFMDVESIRPGIDFVDLLQKQVSECAVMLTVIGQQWLNAADEKGARRLDNPNDFVRIEIESALRLHKRIIPVLVNNSRMPTPAELPDTLKPLARLQAIRLTHEKFRSDIDELVTLLQAEVGPNSTAAEHNFVRASPIRPPAFYFSVGETLASFGFSGEQPYRFESDQVAYVRLSPAHYQPPIGLAGMTNFFQTRKIQPMSINIGGLATRNKFGPIIIDPEGANTITGLTQGFPTGELWGVNGKIFVPHPSTNHFNGTTNIIRVIPVIAFERLLVKTVHDYVDAARQLGVRVPYTVELGAVSLDNVFLGCPGGETGGISFEGPILQSTFQKLKRTNNDRTHCAERHASEFF
ncbi:MAG TPA: toll/interleukin-1 receptor domain-containing protein [Xanthobacteraceae bacterium]|jgi:hypothetical protein|nr:toll/interleukin-1 receptor domain-containing protein [Xanthobacteraceae bacterium]